MLKKPYSNHVFLLPLVKHYQLHRVKRHLLSYQTVPSINLFSYPQLNMYKALNSKSFYSNLWEIKEQKRLLDNFFMQSIYFNNGLNDLNDLFQPKQFYHSRLPNRYQKRHYLNPSEEMFLIQSWKLNHKAFPIKPICK